MRLARECEKKIPIFKTTRQARDFAKTWSEDEDSPPIGIIRLPKEEQRLLRIKSVDELDSIRTWGGGLRLNGFSEAYPYIYELYRTLFGEYPTMASVIDYDVAIGPHIDRFAAMPQAHLNLCTGGIREVRAARTRPGMSKMPAGRAESFAKVYSTLGLSSAIYSGRIGYGDITIMDSSLHEFGWPAGGDTISIEAVRLAQCVNPLQSGQ